MIEKIMQYTVDDAGCSVWKRSCCNGHPCMRVNNKTKLIRRLLWEEIYGQINDGFIVRMTCETKLCVNIEHIELTTYKKLAKQLGAIGVMSGIKRSAAIAKTKRSGKQAKLTGDAVIEIRSSNETTIELSKKFFVSQAHISKVRKNKAWRNFESPWAGLM